MHQKNANVVNTIQIKTRQVQQKRQTHIHVIQGVVRLGDAI